MKQTSLAMMHFWAVVNSLAGRVSMVCAWAMAGSPNSRAGAPKSFRHGGLGAASGADAVVTTDFEIGFRTGDGEERIGRRAVAPPRFVYGSMGVREYGRLRTRAARSPTLPYSHTPILPYSESAHARLHHHSDLL